RIPFRYLCAAGGKRTMHRTGGFMSKSVRTTLALVAGLALCSAVALAQGSSNSSDKSKTKSKGNSTEQHSRLSKVAFWRHKGGDNNSKPSQPKHAQVKPASAKQPQPKQAAPKHENKQPKNAVAKNQSKPAKHEQDEQLAKEAGAVQIGEKAGSEETSCQGPSLGEAATCEAEIEGREE